MLEAAPEGPEVSELNEARKGLALVGLEGRSISICEDRRMLCHAACPPALSNRDGHLGLTEWLEAVEDGADLERRIYSKYK